MASCVLLGDYLSGREVILGRGHNYLLAKQDREVIIITQTMVNRMPLFDALHYCHS